MSARRLNPAHFIMSKIWITRMSNLNFIRIPLEVRCVAVCVYVMRCYTSKLGLVETTELRYVDHYIRSYYKNLVFFKNTRKFISTAYVCGLSGRFDFLKVK